MEAETPLGRCFSYLPVWINVGVLLSSFLQGAGDWTCAGIFMRLPSAYTAPLGAKDSEDLELGHLPKDL